MAVLTKRPIKACVFDLGNTLINDTQLADAAIGEMAAWLLEKALIPSVREFVSTFQQINYNTHKPFISHTFGELEFFERTFSALSIDAISAEAALKQYRTFLIDRFHIDRQIVDTFRYLKQKGLRIALLSNERIARVNAYLEKTALLPFFDLIIVSEAVGFEKPDRRIFEKTLARLKIGSEEMIMFGDNEVADGACSSLDIYFVLVTAFKNEGWIFEKGSSFKPDYVMQQITPDEMQSCLKALSL